MQDPMTAPGRPAILATLPATKAFLPPDSISRRVGAESALLLGGGRALLLQLAHPAVARGVRDHSQFQSDPFGRLVGTLEAVYGVVFGDEQLAIGIGRGIQRRHDRVTGPTYAANDPANLLWVHATLVDTALRLYRLFVGTLTTEEEEAYYHEQQRVAAVFGCPIDEQPATLADFRVWFDEQIAGFDLEDVNRAMIGDVLHPDLPWMLAPVLVLIRFLTYAILPDPLRRQLRIPWGGTQRRLGSALVFGLRAGYRMTPRPLRILPSTLFTRRAIGKARERAAANAAA